MDTIGLSESSARSKLEADGPNELPTTQSRHLLVLLKEVLLEPMVTLLLGCGAIYIALGDRRIGKVREAANAGATRLQAETRGLVRILAVIATLLCLVVVFVYALTRHDWLGGILSGLTLAMAILPIALGLPLVLLSVHVAFLHLIIEPSSTDSMERPPRRTDEPLFSKDLIVPSLIQGLVVFGIVLGVFLISIYPGQRERDARALTFTTLIIANLGLIFVNRSWSRTVLEALLSPNRALWWVVAGALCFLGLVLYLPIARELFRFSLLHPIDLAICFGASLISVVWFESWKLIQKRRRI